MVYDTIYVASRGVFLPSAASVQPRSGPVRLSAPQSAYHLAASCCGPFQSSVDRPLLYSPYSYCSDELYTQPHASPGAHSKIQQQRTLSLVWEFNRLQLGTRLVEMFFIHVYVERNVTT